MNKLKRSTSAKAIAMLLLALCIPVTLFSGAVVAIFSESGVYSAETLADADLHYDILDFDLNVLDNEELYYSSEAQQQFRMQFGREFCDTVVTVTSKDGTVLLQNYHAETFPSSVAEYTLSYGGSWRCDFSEGHDNRLTNISYDVLHEAPVNNIPFSQWLYEKYNINTYGMTDGAILGDYGGFIAEYNTDIHTSTETIRSLGYYNVTLARSRESVDFLSSEYLLIEGFELRWVLVGIAIGGLVLSLGLFIFLCKAAGWRRNGDQPTGTWVERIPLGIFLGGSFLGLALLFLIAEELSYFSQLRLFSVICFAAAVYAFVLACVAVLHSLIARFKLKGWWRYTLVYIIYRAFRWVFENMSDLWQILLCIAAWIFGNFILVLLMFEAPGLGLVLIALFNLAAAAGIIVIVLQWLRLRKGAAAIASGDTSARVDTGRMFPALKSHGENINRIGEGVAQAVEEQLRSERMKTDLITNVSHDLKTPLTSIVSYVGLLKGETIHNETARGYIDTLDRQAVRLGRLIEDLVEASKVTSGSITPSLAPVNVAELLEQAVSEYDGKLAGSSLTPVLTVHGDTLTAFADGRLLWRIFDNLLSNACKYAMPGTRLYIDAAPRGEQIAVCFRNISAEPLNIPADELMERFVRGDSSRTTSGSGLGLTIARSLTELQGGTFSLDIDGDLFKAYVTVPAGQPEPPQTVEEEYCPGHDLPQDDEAYEPVTGSNEAPAVLPLTDDRLVPDDEELDSLPQDEPLFYDADFDLEDDEE